MNTQETPAKNRLERKKEETKQKIINVAMLLFQKQGFDSTTMEEISDTVDIAKGTLYNYFPVKEAILSAFIQRSFEQRSQERVAQLHSLPDTRSRMIFILDEMLPKTQAQKMIVEKFLVYRVQSILSLHKTEGEKSGVELLAVEIIRLGQAAGEIRTDLPPGILEDQFEFIFIEVMKQLTREPETSNTNVIIERCVDLFINGSKTQKAR